MRRLIILALLAAFCLGAEDWGPVQFLIGKWTADAAPGQGTGSFTLAPDLQGKVLLRRNHADIPPAAGRPAAAHDDLMIIYREQQSRELRALYFDNEDHIIRYAVRPAGEGAVFVADEPGPGPRYRLTYARDGAAAVKIRFEIAPPGQDFRVYLESRAHKVN